MKRSENKRSEKNSSSSDMKIYKTKSALRSVLFIIISTLVSVLVLTMASCGSSNTGDTDGGVAEDRVYDTFAEINESDSRGRLEIELINSDPQLGDVTGFFVRAFGENNMPLDFVRISCDTEEGINLIEPFDKAALTDATGTMSGKFCGNSPGSFQIQCRAPVGFGLAASDTIIVRGETGDGFEGCPGATGGLPGGGFTDLGSIFITRLQFTDAGGTTFNGPIDLSRNPDCNGDGVGTQISVDPETGEPIFDDANPGDDVEPFEFLRYEVEIQNNLVGAFTIDTITFNFIGPGGQFSSNPIGVVQTVPGVSSTLNNSNGTESGESRVIQGIMENLGNFIGTNVAIGPGLYAVNVIIDGTRSATGERTRLSVDTTLTFDFVNNCQ